MSRLPARRTPGRRTVVVIVVLALVSLVASEAPSSARVRHRASRSARAGRSAPARQTLVFNSATAKELARVRAQRVKSAARINALKASNSRVTTALKVLNSNVQTQTIRLNNARRSAANASADAQRAQARVRAAEARLASLRKQRSSVAVQAYVTPAGSDLSDVLTSSSASEASDRQTLLDLANRRNADVIDELGALTEDLENERLLAAAAERRARENRTAVARRLAGLQSARARQQRVAIASEAAYERALGEAEALKAINGRLASKYAAEVRAFEAQLARARRSARGKVIVGPSGGPISIPEIAVGGGGSTHGIRVAPSIQGDLARMLAAARASGIYLSGGGYRSPAGQIALRRAHCGSSTYAIYQAPARSCRPPTARPGQSMHERGLAIDFTDGRGTLTYGSRGYRWLVANAGRFGFRNLRGEPWHWSINGR